MGELFDTDELRELCEPARFEQSNRALVLREALARALNEIDRLVVERRERTESYTRASHDQYEKLEAGDESWHDAERRRMKAENLVAALEKDTMRLSEQIDEARTERDAAREGFDILMGALDGYDAIKAHACDTAGRDHGWGAGSWLSGAEIKRGDVKRG